MRKQPTMPRTGRKKRIALYALLAVLLAGTAFTIWRGVIYKAPYVPPEFEVNAVKGTPTVPEDMAYGEVKAENGFAFSMVGAMFQQEDGSIKLYFTNPETSLCNLMCEIADTYGNVLYRSGVLCPGEYVERLDPLIELKNEAVEVVVSVNAFEPDTWYSMGTVILNNTLQAW